MYSANNVSKRRDYECDNQIRRVRFAPFPGFERGIGLGYVAGQGEHQGDGVLRGGDGVAGGRVDHGNTGAGCRRYIYVIDADARAGQPAEREKTP